MRIWIEFVLRMCSGIVRFQFCDLKCEVDECKAPVLKETDVSLHTVTFNGSLLKENAFRQNAGPEVDAAWASLGVGCKSDQNQPHLRPDIDV